MNKLYKKHCEFNFLLSQISRNVSASKSNGWLAQIDVENQITLGSSFFFSPKLGY